MSKQDPRIDAYIAESADFAKPILNRIRKLVHAACPDVTETIKWSAPFYEHKGILITTPAFKKHCALIFWKGKLFLGKEREKYRRLTSLADLPGDKILTGYIRQAVALNEAGVKVPRPKPGAVRKITVPDYFLAALKKNKKARSAFENFSPSHKREYVQWIVGAKRAETRDKRVKAAVKRISGDESLNSKYR
jgi:uncharacterized protein YdeI (YjbR/CyaY-like superfamily)